MNLTKTLQALEEGGDCWPQAFSIPARLSWGKKKRRTLATLPERTDDFLLTSFELEAHPAWPTQILYKTGQRLLTHKRIEPWLLRRLVLGTMATISVAGEAAPPNSSGESLVVPILIRPHQKAWFDATCYKRPLCSWNLELHVDGVCCPAGKNTKQRFSRMKKGANNG